MIGGLGSLTSPLLRQRGGYWGRNKGPGCLETGSPYMTFAFDHSCFQSHELTRQKFHSPPIASSVGTVVSWPTSHALWAQHFPLPTGSYSCRVNTDSLNFSHSILGHSNLFPSTLSIGYLIKLNWNGEGRWSTHCCLQGLNLGIREPCFSQFSGMSTFQGIKSNFLILLRTSPDTHQATHPPRWLNTSVRPKNVGRFNQGTWNLLHDLSQMLWWMFVSYAVQKVHSCQDKGITCHQHKPSWEISMHPLFFGEKRDWVHLWSEGRLWDIQEWPRRSWNNGVSTSVAGCCPVLWQAVERAGLSLIVSLARFSVHPLPLQAFMRIQGKQRNISLIGLFTFWQL